KLPLFPSSLNAMRFQAPISLCPDYLIPVRCRGDGVEIRWKTSSYLYAISTISYGGGCLQMAEWKD
ncbi:MAG: hypothetical protein LHW56_09760, partial [Candidatus Cloacimonetes bacterium]|nr:hypothetical protein [Candidatus Cloacimonadota bacterium]MDY0173177.1 hypothetical protein [Candidatus Cloacimonadaceae bacterium]